MNSRISFDHDSSSGSEGGSASLSNKTGGNVWSIFGYYRARCCAGVRALEETLEAVARDAWT